MPIAAQNQVDTVITDIVRYVYDTTSASPLALETARLCLLDTLGCGLQALSYPACTKLLGPIVPGTTVPHGATSGLWPQVWRPLACTPPWAGAST